LQRVISRETLEQLCEDLVDRTVDICRQTLQDAQLGKEDIEEIVLVGGMTRMPRVVESVAEFFGRDPCKGFTRTRSSRSAPRSRALRCSTRSTRWCCSTSRRTPSASSRPAARSAGSSRRTRRCPPAASETFTTSRDNQTAVKILVMQGEHEKGEENELLGEFVLTDLRKAAKGRWRSRSPSRSTPTASSA